MSAAFPSEAGSPESGSPEPLSAEASAPVPSSPGFSAPAPSASLPGAPLQPPQDAATPVVSAFYDRFPYPGDPLQDGPPPGYNWRWCVDSARSAARGGLPPAPVGRPRAWRILDAGCGTGVSTDYLGHLNPGSRVLAVDISGGALALARERCRRSGAADHVAELRIEQRSLLDLEGEGPFDYINSVGVLHHLREPEAGLRALAQRLAPDGVLHLFLYADGGRWEIHRTQKALGLMGVGSGAEGLRLGRQLLRELPESNRLRRHHEQRWALDTTADANFADMYLHPQETSYDVDRLLAFVAAAGLHFAGFSNPPVWDPARLLGGELLERARALPPVDQWRLVEALDPDISHFEFFLTPDRPSLPDWSGDRELLEAGFQRNRCLWGWPSASLLGPDLTPLAIEEADVPLVQAIEAASAGPASEGPASGGPGTGCRLAELPLAMPLAERLERARRLLELRVLLPVWPGAAAAG